MFYKTGTNDLTALDNLPENQPPISIYEEEEDDYNKEEGNAEEDFDY